MIESNGATVPVILQSVKSSIDTLDTRLLNRFGKTLNLDKVQLKQLIIEASAETPTLSNNAQLKLLPEQKNESSVDAASKIDVTNAEDDLLSERLYPIENSVNLNRSIRCTA